MNREADGVLPAWLPWAAVCAAFAAYALLLFDASLWHPGFAYGDERAEIGLLQGLREGAPFLWQFGHGCLSRASQALWVELSGTGLASLHTPALAAAACEWVLLALVARRWFGEEAACWSVLALTLCAQTWVRERSLLSFQYLPMETLLLAVLASRVRGWASAFALGLGASLLFLDYDGAFIAVPGVLCACAALDPRFRRRWIYCALGLALGALILAWHGQASLGRYLAVRLGHGPAHADDPGLVGRLVFLRQLATGGPVLPYLGVTDWPAWPLWAWAGLAAGVWASWGAPAFVLALWAGAGILVTQTVHSAYGLPLHRLAAVAPALALLTGLGFSRLRRRLGSRAWVLAFVLLGGAAWETWGWCRHQMTFAPELYDRSETLQRVRAGYAADLADPSVRVVTQLDGLSDADARFVLDRRLALGGPAPEKVLALVPADYATALRGSGLRADWIWAEKGLEPAVVVRASGLQAARLAAIEDALAPLAVDQQDSLSSRLERIRSWLAAPVKRDPWTLTAAIEADLQTAVQVEGVSPAEFSRLEAAPLVSAAPWMVIARTSHRADPKAALGYCLKALALDPNDGEALLVEAECLRALGDPRAAAAASQAWVGLRASGAGWRHTL